MKLPTTDERLRQESPAYRPDDNWDELEPQGMQVVLSVRFDPVTAQRLTSVARATERTPSALLRDWTIERLATLGMESETMVVSRIGEAAGSYAAEAGDDEALRQQYRPAKVETLMVGESRPAGGTFFYRANSNLFYATRQAFQLAHGSAPAGKQFLEALKERGFWLYDIADRPVDRMRGRPRQSAIQERVFALVQLLRDSRPAAVVAIKKDLAATVRQAMEEAELPTDQLHVLPFPLYQWRRHYVSGLAELLRRGSEYRPPDLKATSSSVATDTRGEGDTQRVTSTDIKAGRVRFPARARPLMPHSETVLRVDLRGRQFGARYDPRDGPDRSRSGVLSIPRNVLAEVVAPDETLTFVRSGESIRLR